MLQRAWVVLLLLTACGGELGTVFDDGRSELAHGGENSGGSPGGDAGKPAASSGTGGSVEPTAGKAGAGGAPSETHGGTSGQVTGGSGGALNGGAGGLGGAGGKATGGGGQAGGGRGGTGGAATGGKPAVDPLEPVPADNCPGYEDILVPVGTCLRFKSDPPRSYQNEACDVVSPGASTSCGTVTAANKDTSSRVSVGAKFERADIDHDTGLCAKTCP